MPRFPGDGRTCPRPSDRALSYDVIDDRGVVAALIGSMKSLVNSSELTYLPFGPEQVKGPKCPHNSTLADSQRACPSLE